MHGESKEDDGGTLPVQVPMQNKNSRAGTVRTSDDVNERAGSGR